MGKLVKVSQLLLHICQGFHVFRAILYSIVSLDLRSGLCYGWHDGLSFVDDKTRTLTVNRCRVKHLDCWWRTYSTSKTSTCLFNSGKNRLMEIKTIIVHGN